MPTADMISSVHSYLGIQSCMTPTSAGNVTHLWAIATGSVIFSMSYAVFLRDSAAAGVSYWNLGIHHAGTSAITASPTVQESFAV